MLRTLARALLACALLLAPLTARAANRVDLYLFWGEGCPHCEHERASLGDLQQQYPTLRVHTFEVYHDAENLTLLHRVGERLGTETNAVPITIIGDTTFVGFSSTESPQRLSARIEECLQQQCTDSVASLLPTDDDPVPDDDASLFPDVPETHPNRTAIEYLKTHDVLSGYPDGFYRPASTISRVELLKIIMNALQVPRTYDAQYAFPDVPAGTWYAPYVSTALRLGHVQGDGGLFYPDRGVNRVEALKIALNLYGEPLPAVSTSPYTDIAVTSWYAPYVARSKAWGLVAPVGSLFSPARPMARAEVAEMIYRILQER